MGNHNIHNNYGGTHIIHMHTHTIKELYIHNIIILYHGGTHTYPQGSAHVYIDGRIMHTHVHDGTCPGMYFHSKWHSINFSAQNKIIALG